MYEQTEVSMFRRIITIVLTCIAAIAVVWLFVWLLFFRHSTPTVSKKPATTSNHQPTTSQPAPNTPDTTPTTPTTTPAPATPTSTNATPTTQTPATQLANTGAGDTIALFTVTVLVGTSLYHVHLRRKSVQ